MSFEKSVPPPVPACSQDLVALLKLQLTKAVIDGKANEAKIYLDVIERLSKMAWLDDLTLQERGAQRQKERAAATDRLNEYISNWMKENPED
jgi:hypothetical protein